MYSSLCNVCVYIHSSAWFWGVLLDVPLISSIFSFIFLFALSFLFCAAPSLGVCYLEAREADAEMRDAQIRFRAVAEFAAPLILASASIEPCTDHDHYPILSFTGLTPPSLPASPPARSLCHRPTRSLSQESCLAALSFVPRPPAPSPTSAAMSTLLVLASSQPPQPSAISSSPSVPRAPPVLHTPLGSQVLHNRPFNALRDWSDEPEAEAKLLVPASLDSLTDELVRLNEIMAAACRPSGKSGRQLHPPTSIQSQPPSRTSPSTEQAVAMSAELEISAGAETEGANSAQRSRCTLASSSLFPVLSSPAPAASDDIRIRLNPERVNSGCSNAAQSASDLLSFSRDAVMVYSDDLSASLATASQCVDSGLAQEPPTRSLSMPNAPASYESLSSRIDPSQSTIVQHASGDARGDRHRLERELSEASPFAYEHVLGYHEVKRQGDCDRFDCESYYLNCSRSIAVASYCAELTLCVAYPYAFGLTAAGAGGLSCAGVGAG